MTVKKRPTMTIHQLANKLAGEIDHFLSVTAPRWMKLNELIRCRYELAQTDRKWLITVLRKLADRAEGLAVQLEAPADSDHKLTTLALLAARIVEDTAKLKSLVNKLDRRDVLDGLKQHEVTLKAIELPGGDIDRSRSQP
jgi:hypothetical protein